MEGIQILSIVTFFPLVGVIALFFIDRENVVLQKTITLIVTTVTLYFLSICLFALILLRLTFNL
jgi:NADH:ubiquinone oxidoreductase subunit 4 (subunit M)